MKRGQIYSIKHVLKNEGRSEIDLTDPYLGILIINDKGIAPVLAPTVIVIPIVQNDGRSMHKGVEITPAILEEGSMAITGFALAEEARTIDISLLNNKFVGCLNSEGVKLIDKAILRSLGVDLPTTVE